MNDDPVLQHALTLIGQLIAIPKDNTQDKKYPKKELKFKTIMNSMKFRISLLSNTDRNSLLFFCITFLSSLFDLVLGYTHSYGPTIVSTG